MIRVCSMMSVDDAAGHWQISAVCWSVVIRVGAFRCFLVSDSVHSKLSEEVLQIRRVRKTVPCVVGPALSLVVNLIPCHSVLLSSGRRLANGEYEPPVPGIHQKLQCPSALIIVRQVSVPRESSCSVRHARPWVLRPLNSRRDVVCDLNGATAIIARECERQHLEVHDTWRLVALFHSIHGLTHGTLQVACLWIAFIHSCKAGIMEMMAAVGKAHHLATAVVGRGGNQWFTTDAAVLCWNCSRDINSVPCEELFRFRRILHGIGP